MVLWQAFYRTLHTSSDWKGVFYDGLYLNGLMAKLLMHSIAIMFARDLALGRKSWRNSLVIKQPSHLLEKIRPKLKTKFVNLHWLVPQREQ